MDPRHEDMNKEQAPIGAPEPPNTQHKNEEHKPEQPNESSNSEEKPSIWKRLGFFGGRKRRSKKRKTFRKRKHKSKRTKKNKKSVRFSKRNSYRK